MKTKIAIFFFTVFVVNTQTITVDGYAFLESSLYHNSIKILFERTAPSSLIDTTYTDSTGFFSINIEPGIYNIIYSKHFYQTRYLSGIVLYSPTELPIITLNEIGLSGPISGVIEPRIFEVLSDIYVPSDDTLIIMPGATLMFSEGTGLTIHGVLNANGTVSDSIIFTWMDSSDWKGIKLAGGINRSELSYCRIEHCDSFGIYASSYFILENSMIRSCGHYGIYSHNADMKNIHFEDNFRCAYINGSLLTNSLFKDFIFCGLTINGGTVKNSLFLVDSSGYDMKYGIICNSGNIINNTIVNIYSDYPMTQGIRIEGPISHPPFPWIPDSPVIINCIIAYFHSCGIYTYGESEPYIANCDFWANYTNTWGASIPDWLLANVTINENGDSCDPWGNIKENPMFINTGTLDFHLLEGSRCLDAGTNYIVSGIDTIWAPNEDFEDNIRPFGLRCDIGAYEGYMSVISRNYQKPTDFFLSAYPNPFNSSVRISISTVGATHASPLQQSIETGHDPFLHIEIFDIAGRKVAEFVSAPFDFAQGAVSWSSSDGCRAKSRQVETRSSSDGCRAKSRQTEKITIREFIWTPDETVGNGVYLVRARFDEKTTATQKIIYLR